MFLLYFGSQEKDSVNHSNYKIKVKVQSRPKLACIELLAHGHLILLYLINQSISKILVTNSCLSNFHETFIESVNSYVQ